MIHYLNLGGEERPICFDYSVAYEYESQHGKNYDADVVELARQLITAGAAIGTDDVGIAARGMSVVKYVDIMHSCLLVGHRKTRTPVNFDKYDVADWLRGADATLERFTELLFEANFNLKATSENGQQEGPDPAKQEATTAPAE